MCPFAGIVVGAVKISPHTLHFTPAVDPSVVHVASTAGIASSVCPASAFV